ncbi:MAG: acyl--CoA ligase [Chloroflexi bacterium]|nr:acyl--CoA ligase [Chloroflexota bacterium]
MLIPDELREQAERFPDRVAVQVNEGGAMTYGEWDSRSNAIARGLVASGLPKGGRVALLLENDAALEFYLSYFATHKAAGVVVPVNPRYAPREIEHILSNCQAHTVIVAGQQVERLRALREQTSASWQIIAPGASGDGELDWDELPDGDASPFQVALDEDDLAEILYTSGTTGLPKGVASTHKNATSVKLPAVEEGGCFLHSIPLATFFGTHGAQLFALRLAVTNTILPRFDAQRFAQLIASEQPRWLVMVPAHALLLLESGALADIDTSSVQTIVYGSAPMPPEAVEGLAAAFPKAAQINGYGLTEAGGSACVLPPGEALARAGSVGKPLPGVRLRILDEEGNECSSGQVGEVVLKMTAGERFYYADPENTAKTWRDGWVYTGDLGYLDEDGYLYIADRKKDMIIRGGYNVYSIEVENALYEHADVVEVAVLPMPHKILGQDILAVVRLAKGASLDLETAREFLRDRLADYKLPRRLEVRSEPLPRSGMGKVDKRALAASLGLNG